MYILNNQGMLVKCEAPDFKNSKYKTAAEFRRLQRNIDILTRAKLVHFPSRRYELLKRLSCIISEMSTIRIKIITGHYRGKVSGLVGEIKDKKKLKYLKRESNRIKLILKKDYNEWKNKVK